MGLLIKLRADLRAAAAAGARKHHRTTTTIIVIDGLVAGGGVRGRARIISFVRIKISRRARWFSASRKSAWPLYGTAAFVYKVVRRRSAVSTAVATALISSPRLFSASLLWASIPTQAGPAADGGPPPKWSDRTGNSSRFKAQNRPPLSHNIILTFNMLRTTITNCQLFVILDIKIVQGNSTGVSIMVNFLLITQISFIRFFGKSSEKYKSRCRFILRSISTPKKEIFTYLTSNNGFTMEKSIFLIETQRQESGNIIMKIASSNPRIYDLHWRQLKQVKS
jgi:hypothetical protein